VSGYHGDDTIAHPIESKQIIIFKNTLCMVWQVPAPGKSAGGKAETPKCGLLD
jgi:hypothetical protein